VRARAERIAPACFGSCCDALARDAEEETLAAYRTGRLSLTEASSRLRIDPWSFFDLLRRRGEPINVTIEDWMDSASSSGS
jgi:hypothetical protein